MLVSCLLLGGCSMLARGTAAAPASAATSGRAADQPPVTTPVVVVGVGGLTWDAVSPDDTPRLWQLLTEDAAAGSMTVRQIGPSCPVDGWLSLSSGRATAGPPPQPVDDDDAAADNSDNDDLDSDDVGTDPSQPTARHDRACGPLPEVRSNTGDTDGSGGEASVPEWQQLQELQDTWDFAPQLGLLGDSLAELDVCATAVGPGAALALADSEGVVPRFEDEVGPASFDCPITLIDAGNVIDRDRDLTEVDRHVGDVLDNVPANSTVLVMGVSERPGVYPELAAAFLSGPSVTGPPRFLVTSSTRWDGVLRLLDVPTTLLAAVGGSDPDDFSGAPIRFGGRRPAAPAESVRVLDDITRTDQIRGKWTDDLRNWLGAAQLVLYAVALLAVGRGWQARWSGRGFTALLLCFAATPLAAYLVTLSEWWRAGSPDRALWGGLVAIAAALAVVAGRIPKRPLWWATGGLSLLTFGILVLDALVGTPLHRGSLLGPSPARGGRYFGFGNDTFSVFVVVALLTAGAIAAELLARDRRRLAVGAVIALGTLTLLVDVWPKWGANVGGGLALLPGITLLALAVAGIRITALRLAGASVGGVALVGAVAFADWLRPERDRSHSGRFVQDIIDGDAWEIVSRKAGYARDSLNDGLPMWITIAVLVAAAAALLRPERYAPDSLLAAFAEWPTLRATLGSILLTILIGSFVNDYGLRIATISLTMGLPLVALTCARSNGRQPPPKPEEPALAAVAPPTDPVDRDLGVNR